jgi:cation diffusion facilitator CzcD-associated flavoprotein CzcO
MSTRFTPGNSCEVIVIGAGPYGLAAAAHLKDRGVDTRVFGEPMSFWRRNMPKGMFLRSPWGATDISDPHQALSLGAYIKARRMPRIEPLPLETFVGYGEWFQARAVADLDRRRVERVEPAANGFRVITTDGDAVNAGRIVVAMGLAQQAFRPEVFVQIADTLTSHSGDHDGFERFRGKHVAVVGRGQSACESAVLLREAGADVDLICRGPIHWLSYAMGTPAAPAWQAAARAKLSGLLATPSGVGPFPLNWMVEFPHLVRRLPADMRSAFNAASLRAGAAGWLLPRFHGIQVMAGAEIDDAIEKAGRIELKFGRRSASYDHVLLATGYKTEIAKLGIFAPHLLNAVACRDGAPLLSGSFESSVPGLYFIGASAVASLGPLLRFIAGTRFAARRVADATVSSKTARRPYRDESESNLAA